MKNTNNAKISYSFSNYPNFRNNPDLSCILVDNQSYSDANWNAKKDQTSTYSDNCSLGTDNSVFQETVLYPNPTRGLLTIKNGVLDKVIVYNVLGQLQKTFVFLNNTEDHNIDLSELTKGAYIVVLEKDNKTASRKIIIN